MVPGDNQTSIPITVETPTFSLGAVCDRNTDDTAGSLTVTDFTTPLPGQNTNLTDHHLSLVHEEGSPCEKEVSYLFLLRSRYNVVVVYVLSGCVSYCQIEFLLSLIEIPTFSLGLSQDELLHEKTCLASVADTMANNDIAETRKSKRTRILPPLFNDFHCDPKIKAFRADGPLTTTADNIDQIYTAMREKAGHNKYVPLSPKLNRYSYTSC